MREPDPMSVVCPKCDESNFFIRSDKPPIINVRYVEDERGPHYECNTCSHHSSVEQATRWAYGPVKAITDEEEEQHAYGYSR